MKREKERHDYFMDFLEKLKAGSSNGTSKAKTFFMGR